MKVGEKEAIEMTEYSNLFYDKIFETLNAIKNKEGGNIENAANIITESFLNDKVLHVLGTGHSMIITQELFYRAGSLVPVNAIMDPSLSSINAVKSTLTERLSGYAKVLLDYYGISKNDVLLVISLSGVNAVPVEAAVEAKERDAYVIALTSFEASSKLQPRNKYGKRLYEVANITIDNHAPFGDASVRLKNLPQAVAPLSTIANAFIVNLIVIKVAENYLAKGLQPPIWVSSNVPEGDKANEKYLEKYQNKIRHL